jgi:DNA polymerase elongation subunit (family B)
MFQERLKLKKQKNPLQNVFKLILNSSYGKLLQKAIKHNKEFISSDKVDKYVIRNYKFINTYTKINDNLYCVKTDKSTIQHFTCVHIASLILSMSKRIMNEVMCLAEDNDIKIMYQDTDSMHLFNKDLTNLEEIYEKKYNRVLTGNNMGQFNSDFEVKEAGATNIIAVESIFLGKKCYIDKLRYTNKFGNTKYDYHVRIKGVPSQSIKDYNSSKNGIMNTYRRLYNGEKL